MGLAELRHRLLGDDLVCQMVQCRNSLHGLLDGVLAAVVVVFIAGIQRLCRVTAVTVYDDLAGIHAAVTYHQISALFIMAAGLHADAEIGVDQIIFQ